MPVVCHKQALLTVGQPLGLARPAGTNQSMGLSSALDGGQHLQAVWVLSTSITSPCAGNLQGVYERASSSAVVQGVHKQKRGSALVWNWP